MGKRKIIRKKQAFAFPVDYLNPVVINGESLAVIKTMPPDSIDSIVTDPPYEFSFMSHKWDNTGIAFSVEFWAECLRVLKPGGHLLSFGGSRTSHRMVTAIEDAGFEIRDSIVWLYGSGFPKSLDVAKTIDKAAGAKKVVGVGVGVGSDKTLSMGSFKSTYDQTEPATDDAKKWEGFGTSLKPAHEPICVARKPLSEKTVAANVLTHGTGGINIAASRITVELWVCSASPNRGRSGGIMGKKIPRSAAQSHSAGRWPANVILQHSDDCEDTCVDGCPVPELDKQSGKLTSGKVKPEGFTGSYKAEIFGKYEIGMIRPEMVYGDSGGASRFFYQAKATKKERPSYESDIGKVMHPTVKSLQLMRYLVKMVTPPDGIILEPFAGSGTTVEAAMLEKFKCVAIEMTPEYIPLIQQRIDRVPQPSKRKVVRRVKK